MPNLVVTAVRNGVIQLQDLSVHWQSTSSDRRKTQCTEGSWSCWITPLGTAVTTRFGMTRRKKKKKVTWLVQLNLSRLPQEPQHQNKEAGQIRRAWPKLRIFDQLFHAVLTQETTTHGKLLVAVTRTLLANAALLAIALNRRANPARPSVAAALPCRLAVFSVTIVVDV